MPRYSYIIIQNKSQAMVVDWNLNKGKTVTCRRVERLFLIVLYVKETKTLKRETEREAGREKKTLFA